MQALDDRTGLGADHCQNLRAVVVPEREPTFLMSPPTYYSAHFMLNPWMQWWEEVSPTIAARQWEGLAEAIRRAGGIVRVMPESPRANALAFIRDGVLVYGPGKALALRVGGVRALVETPRIARWMEDRGYHVERFPPRGRLDGGNVLPAGDRWLLGMTPTTDGGPERALARLMHAATGRPVTGVWLPLRRFNHVDTVLADLAGWGWLVYRRGLGEPNLRSGRWAALFGDRPVIEVSDQEAERLACNVLMVGRTAIAGWMNRRLERRIGGLGLSVEVVSLDEFRKAGAGPHCLAVEL